MLARFQKAPTQYCLQGAKRGLRYQTGTNDYGIMYVSSDFELSCLVNSDLLKIVLIANIYLRFWGKLEALFVYSDLKTANCTSSTSEGEYDAITQVATDILWLSRVLKRFSMEC